MALDNDRSKVAHLLRRAGFGYTEAELEQYTLLGFGATVDRLLNYEAVDDSATTQLLEALKGEPTKLDLTKIEDAKFFWFNRMLHTKRPLQEKMTLFWHDHFATANSKVGNPPLMLQQIDLFRANALGNFETLLQQVTRDPAMLIWLDNRANRKASPNENYAREVMELFTTGIGHYTESDVKEAARAFTGYTLDRERKFTFNKSQHDNGNKTFMGITRNWDANDILAHLVRHPATARFVTTRLFRYFVYDNPEPATIDRLANTFTTSGFSIKAVVQDILTGPEFLSPQAFHGLVQQPVDYVVGSLKLLNTQMVGRDVTQLTRRMNQDLLNPPDVNGWPTGSGWVNSTTLLARFNFANRITTAREAGKPYFTDINGHVKSLGLDTPDALVDYYARLLVDGDLTPEAREALKQYLAPNGTFTFDERTIDQKVRGMVHVAMSLPAYQLA